LRKEGDYCVSQIDGSIWESASLYDFGWGKENGFIKLPQMGFSELWTLFLNAQIEENIYGAASVLVESYLSDTINTIKSLPLLKKISPHTRRRIKLLDLTSSR